MHSENSIRRSAARIFGLLVRALRFVFRILALRNPARTDGALSTARVGAAPDLLAETRESVTHRSTGNLHYPTEGLIQLQD
jgi:hypothetical protein